MVTHHLPRTKALGPHPQKARVCAPAILRRPPTEIDGCRLRSMPLRDEHIFSDFSAAGRPEGRTSEATALRRCPSVARSLLQRRVLHAIITPGVRTCLGAAPPPLVRKCSIYLLMLPLMRLRLIPQSISRPTLRILMRVVFW